MNPPRKMVVGMQRILNPSQFRSNGLSTLNKDNFTRVMSESLNKAINSTEGPVKEKHVRRLVIGSFQAESGLFFWQLLPAIRLKENQIVCWKFCHVLHKIIRDGHRQVLINSVDNIKLLIDCGNMWRHVEDGYGSLIHKYCTLLYNRIQFLIRNPRFPCDLKLTDEQLDEVGDHDPHIFFDISCEIFDCLDEILGLQKLVLSNLERKKYGSMTSAGQCHLAPLVACIQDSTLFYDYSVKILFKLHGGLSVTTLNGHRERFASQHKELRIFYTNVSNLQYFKTLIQIPQLSDKPPNFLVASDLQQHVAPQVIMISNPERESPDQLLVNIDEDSYSGDSASVISSVHHSELTASSRNGDSFDAISSQALAVTSDPVIQSSSFNEHKRLRELEDERREFIEKLHETEVIVAQLKSELDLERANHQKTQEQSQLEIKKIRQELSNMKCQLNQEKNSNQRLIDECQRARHDYEIVQIAMKRLVKEANETKLVREVEKQATQQQELDNKNRKDREEEDLLIAEMNEADKVIKEAQRRIEEFIEKSRKVETGIKLQVNERISEVCANLMKAARNLIIQSRILQREIVGGDGKAKRDEFYRRNSSWTDGLISAANEVAKAAKSLVDAADRSMNGSARLSELAAAAHEISAATAQLVVASRVKADKDSDKLKNLLVAAKQVNQCTSSLIETSKVCSELIDQEIDTLDLNALSLHQTKRLEMETQVKLLELESQLSKERTKLGQLRRQHYEQEEASQGSDKTST